MDISIFTADIIVLAVVAAVLAIDDRAGWQSLLAEPVCAAIIIGALTRQYEAALLTGVSLQFVWLSILPMRGARRPDTVAGGVTGIASACILLRHTADPRVAFLAACGVCGGLVVGELAGLAGRQVNRWRESRLAAFRPGASDPDTALRLVFYQVGSVATVALVEATLVAVSLPALLVGIEWVTRRFSGTFVEGADWWLSLLPMLAIAALVQLYWHRNGSRFLMVSAAIFMVVLWIR